MTSWVLEHLDLFFNVLMKILKLTYQLKFYSTINTVGVLK